MRVPNNIGYLASLPIAASALDGREHHTRHAVHNHVRNVQPRTAQAEGCTHEQLLRLILLTARILAKHQLAMAKLQRSIS